MPKPKVDPFEKRCLTPQETADFLGISIESAYRYIKTGQIAATRVGKALIRIDKLWLERFISADPRQRAAERKTRERQTRFPQA